MKVIDLNSRYGKKNADGKSNLETKRSITNLKVKFNKIYSIDKSIDDLIGYKKKNYTSKVGWGIFGLSIFYIYFIAFLFYSYDSFFKIALVAIGEVFIFALQKILYKIIRNLKISNAANTLSNDKINILKGLLKDRAVIKSSIISNKTLDLKYLEKYIHEEKFRENFFDFLIENMHLNTDSTLNKSAEYASKQIRKINFGI